MSKSLTLAMRELFEKMRAGAISEGTYRDIERFIIEHLPFSPANGEPSLKMVLTQSWAAWHAGQVARGVLEAPPPKLVGMDDE